MTQHTLTHIHKRRGFCKAEKTPEKKPQNKNTPEPEPVPEPQKPKITEDIVNQYINILK